MACDMCGRSVPTRNITLHYNIGMIAAYRYNTLQGDLCWTCINHYFWEYMLVTVAIGWWSFLSFFLTPLILGTNLIQWVRSMHLAQPSIGTNIPTAPTPTLAQCPRCNAFHPANAGLRVVVWASLIVTGLLFIVLASSIGSLFYKQLSISSGVVSVFFLIIVSTALASFIMLLRNPLLRCSQCGHTWPALSSSSKL